MEPVLDIYVDGSYLDGQTKWAYIVVENGTEIHSDSGIITDPVICEGRQVGGEIQAVIEAVKYGKSKGQKVRIYADYNGLINWCADIWGGKPWRTTKSYSTAYRKFMLDNQEWVLEMIKIKSHSNNYFNDLVDKLVKNG